MSWQRVYYFLRGGLLLPQKGDVMADKGKKDKGKREQQKTAKLTPKEKRKQKKDKKKNG